MLATILAGVAAMTLMNHKDPAGYLKEPASGHGTGVLVLHPWWGLNGDVKAFCDRLAAAGFVAFAPDLFEGKVTTSKEEAEALVGEYDGKEAELQAKIAEAAAYLESKTGKKEISVVGFSFGAYYALSYSNKAPDRVKAVVVYYGTGQQDFSQSKASYLGHFAERDEFETKEGVDQLAGILKAAGRPATFYTYPNTGHWFVEPSVKEAYNKEAAELAWTRTLEFLKKNATS